MTSLIKRDNNELRYNAIWLLDKGTDPDYYKNLIKNTKAFFYGMNRSDLNRELDKQIHNLIERRVGVDINALLLIYKNLPYLNSFTKSRIAGKQDKYIYKFTIEKWLDEIEKWVFQNVILLEKHIRFTTPPKQHV